MIIGKGGENIRKLMDKHKVHIAIPPADKNEEVIVITGPEKCVASAKIAIDELMEGSFEMLVTVPHKYHSNIIGEFVCIQ